MTDKEKLQQINTIARSAVKQADVLIAELRKEI